MVALVYSRPLYLDMFLSRSSEVLVKRQKVLSEQIRWGVEAYAVDNVSDEVLIKIEQEIEREVIRCNFSETAEEALEGNL
jgi:hypothetical protein